MVAGVYASSGNARKLSFLGPAGAPSKAVRTMHVCAMFERRQLATLVARAKHRLNSQQGGKHEGGAEVEFSDTYSLALRVLRPTRRWPHHG